MSYVQSPGAADLCQVQVALHDAEVRNGTVLLKAHSLQVLGGQVERLGAGSPSAW